MSFCLFVNVSNICLFSRLADSQTLIFHHKFTSPASNIQHFYPILFAFFPLYYQPSAGFRSDTIYYDGMDVGIRRADFVVENKVIVELKALINLEDVHLAQAKNYVVAYGFDIGLLINFGATSLQYKKIFNSKTNPVNPKIK